MPTSEEHFSFWYRVLSWLFRSWGGFELEAGIHTWAPVVFALTCGAVFLMWVVWMTHWVLPLEDASIAVGVMLAELGKSLDHGEVLPSVVSDST